MTGVRWDVRDIMSQHNAYVDILVRVIHSVNLPDSFFFTYIDVRLGYRTSREYLYVDIRFSSVNTS